MAPSSRIGSPASSARTRYPGMRRRRRISVWDNDIESWRGGEENRCGAPALSRIGRAGVWNSDFRSSLDDTRCVIVAGDATIRQSRRRTAGGLRARMSEQRKAGVAPSRLPLFKYADSTRQPTAFAPIRRSCLAQRECESRTTLPNDGDDTRPDQRGLVRAAAPLPVQA